MLGLTLLALRSEPRPHQWIIDAVKTLKEWTIEPAIFNEAADGKLAPAANYKPPRKNAASERLARMSPIQTRQQTANAKCSSLGAQQNLRDDEDDDSYDQSPTPTSRFNPAPGAKSATTKSGRRTMASKSSGVKTNSGNSSTQRMQYCTQKCLRGLVPGGLLDSMCPNAETHGKGHHQISSSGFKTLLRRQLAADLDTDCEQVCVNMAHVTSCFRSGSRPTGIQSPRSSPRQILSIVS
jgi:hypothetical protein